MHTQIRFPVAERVVTPEAHLRHRDTEAHVLNLDYRFRDTHLTLHGTIVGADTTGRYTLLDNIVTGAEKAGIQVDCIAPADWPTPIVAEAATNTWRGPGMINDATARYHEDVQRRNGSDRPLLIVVDYALLVFHQARHRDAWHAIALVGATRNVSVLAVTDDLAYHSRLSQLGRGNLFHLRTPTIESGAEAHRHLPGTRVEDLPAPGSFSYGYAYDPHGDPIPFAVENKRR